MFAESGTFFSGRAARSRSNDRENLPTAPSFRTCCPTYRIQKAESGNRPARVPSSGGRGRISTARTTPTIDGSHISVHGSVRIENSRMGPMFLSTLIKVVIAFDSFIKMLKNS
jgi:hypothetical protein